MVLILNKKLHLFVKHFPHNRSSVDVAFGGRTGDHRYAYHGRLDSRQPCLNFWRTALDNIARNVSVEHVKCCSRVLSKRIALRRRNIHWTVRHEFVRHTNGTHHLEEVSPNFPTRPSR